MNKKTILGIVCWLAAFCVCLSLADRLTRRDDGARKYDAFFEEKQEIDVLFLGTSRILDSILPNELWRDRGITSYNMGNSSEVLDVTEQVLKIAMDVNKPKVAVVDVYYVHHALDEAWTYSYRHMFYDEVPLSRAKVDAVRATMPQKQWLEFLMPFSLYHGRWEEILAGDVMRMVECEKFTLGAELRIGRTERTFTPADGMTEGELPGHDALRRIAALCRENGIEPVFLMVPAPLDEKEQQHVASVAPLAQELGVPFINMLDMGVVDYAADCYDDVGHLNPDGASKTTAYLGQWLSENFDLPDHRGDSAYAHWDTYLAQYEAHRQALWGGMTKMQ